MKRSSFPYLIVVMSFSLLAVLLMQGYWINNAIRIQSAQFDNLAAEALQRAVDKIELSEEAHSTAVMLRKEATGSEPVVFHDEDGKLSWKMEIDTVMDRDKIVKKEVRVEFKAKAKGKRKHKWIIEEHRSTTGEVLMEEIHESEDVQVLTDGDDHINLRVDSNRFKLKVNKMDHVMQRMLLGIRDSSIAIEDRVKDIPVQRILKNELENIGISIPFKCAIIDKKSGEILQIGADAFDESWMPISYGAQLFPADIFLKPQSLLLYFPNKVMRVLRSQWIMLCLSLAFTMILIYAFAASVYQMLHQKKLTEMKNDFINNITHEFKTPLATISLAVDALRQDEVKADKHKLEYFSSIIKEENDRLNSHVENILQVAVLDKNQFKLDPEEVDIHTIIKDALSNMRLQIQKSEATITTNLDAGSSIIMGDKNYLPGVFTNLLDNAIKYAGTVTPVITVSTNNPVPDILQIKVTDNGIGMSKDTSARIFDDFYRKSSGNIHDVKGFGLGLSFVKGTVLAHGGSINVESTEGTGTTFTLTFDTIVGNV